MFRIRLHDDVEAEFYCPFCETTQRWPFGSQILWQGSDQQKVYPEGGHVVASHWFGDWNLKRFGFEPCTKAKAWSTTTWETVDRHSGSVLDSGHVEVVNGYPRITHTP